MAKKEKEKNMFYYSKLARKVVFSLVFGFMVSLAFAGKTHASKSLHKKDAIFCEKPPIEVISEDYLEIKYEHTLKERQERAMVEEELMGLKEPENELEAMALGRKKIVTTSKTTAYCPCKKCCDKNDGITFYEVKAQQYRTVAADKRKYPNGTIVHIPALSDWPNKGWFVVEDIGGAIKNNRIDIFFDNHKVANNYGIQNHEVEFYLP